jgi:hypothetical protein
MNKEWFLVHEEEEIEDTKLRIYDSREDPWRGRKGK